MKIRKITPRGYCYGVVDAMVMARQTAQNLDLPRPIYILGMLVHNKNVVDAFTEEGIITLDGENRLEILEKVTHGTVIFTAHGISPEVRKRAREKGLTVVDATCPDVTRTHDLIREKVADGYEIVYIGKQGHPEPEGAMGVAPEHVHLVQNEEEINALSFKTTNVLVTNQTTMSQWDVAGLIKHVLKRFPTTEVHNEICMATQERQEAVGEQAKGTDLVIVVGDPRSNNSNRLAQVAQDIAGVEAYRVADVTEIKVDWLKGKKLVGVTAGASTPTAITREVIQYLEQFDEASPETWQVKRTVNTKKILPPVKKKKTS